MGMYDTIILEHECCNCGETLTDYQTKALDRCLAEYQLGDTIELEKLELIIGSFEVHDFCGNCHTFIEGRAYVKDKILWRIVEFQNGKEKVIGEYVPGV